MAVGLDSSTELLRVFSDSNRTEMTLIELHKNLSFRITIDEVLRIIRSPNLVHLFNLQPISNDLCLIQLNPKLTLCEACLQKGCKNKGNCTKLHLCRYTSHFTNRPLDKPCHFPHKLSDSPNNLVLLRRFNYDTLDENLLLDLLRLHYSQSQLENPLHSKPPQNHRVRSNYTPNPHFTKPRPPSQIKKSPIPPENPTDWQLDVSIPSTQDAPDIDLEIVQLLLATKDIIVERILEKQISNEFYRRFTLQFPNKQILDHILATESIIVYKTIPIKLKRTQRRRDTKIFALKFSTDQKIDHTRLSLYVETLVGKVSFNIFDMTPNGNNEQIYLIRCEQSIDFEHLYKVHSAKTTLQTHRVIVNEVYQTETIEIGLKHGSEQTIPRLRQLLGEKRWQEDVFACLSIRNQNNAEIELMNAEITAQWLSEATRFERDFSLTLHPVIDFIQSEDDDDEEITTLLPSQNEPNIYTIKPDWRIVLTHPFFGDEYRKYIREHLNISVQITGSVISVPNEYIRKELARYTNMFIQNFLFREISDLDKIEVKKIKDNYPRMAHKWQKDTNKTLVAARRDVMMELFPQLVSASRQQNKTLTTPTFRSKQSPIPKQQDSPIREEIIQTKENSLLLPYSIENSVYFPFFKPSNSFPDRLRTYLSDAFNIKLNIKPITSTKILLELKGQSKDVGDARSALHALFSSLKTKTYSDTRDSCKFSIPDVSHLAQWNLDQSSIVCSCSFSSSHGGILSVRYFTDHPQFGIDEQKLDEILLHRLFDLSYQVLLTSQNLEIHLQELTNQIQQRSDYGQTICCFYNHQKDLPTIDLYGIKSIVQEIYQDIKKISDQYTPISCHVQLQSNEIDYLLKICTDDLKQIEKDYAKDGVDLRSKFQVDSSEFLAPKYLHEKLKLFLFEMSRIESISKEFQSSAQIINSKKQELNNLATKNRCLIAITMSSGYSQSTTSIPSKISSGSIHISNGDLAMEPADVLVVCSSSVQLRSKMIQSAGLQVEQELAGKDLAKTMIDTSAGQLKQTKRLLFIPWLPPQTYFTSQDVNSLRQSISTFVQHAIKYTLQAKLKSIAFPAIGCGGFGIHPDVIASIMIDVVREQLTLNSTVQLTIIFVVQQAHAFDSFKARLKPSSNTTTRTRSPSPPRSANPEKVNITLTTSNSNIDTARKLFKIYDNMLN